MIVSLLLRFSVVLLGVVPYCEFTHNEVDKIEINHVYNEEAKPVIDQVIYWRWNDIDNRYDVQDWELTKDSGQVSYNKDHYEILYYHPNSSIGFRKVTSQVFEESWTQYDKEIFERNILPEDKRIHLWNLRRN